MLLAEELALVAIKPETGRPSAAIAAGLPIPLAGLLVAELVTVGRIHFAADGSRFEAVAAAPGEPPPAPALAATGAALDRRGDLTRALRAMRHDLWEQLGTGTWDTAMTALVATGMVSTPEGRLRPKVDVLDPGRRELIVARLREAAAGQGPLDDRTAALLNATGPARLLRLVAPDWRGRRHARYRIDHFLDHTPLGLVGAAVREAIRQERAAKSH